MTRPSFIPHGERIRDLRARKDLTQEELAEKAGYSKRTIERMENGASAVYRTIEDVAEVLGVEPDVLLLNDKEISKKRAHVEHTTEFVRVKLGRRFDEFTNEDQVRLVRALATILHVGGEIKVIDKRCGCVELCWSTDFGHLIA